VESRRRREALFAGLVLRLADTHPDVTARGDLGSCFEDFRQLPSDERSELAGHPVFALALQQFLRVDFDADDAVLVAEAASMTAAYRRARDAMRDRDVARIGRTELRRWDTDPLIIERAPPTYIFPPAAERERRAGEDIYTLERFAVIAEAALARIGDVWPQLRRWFDWLVRVIVQVPDAPYRSASAARYRGVVFLSSDDTTLMELEESLVHEFGHQILYEVMARSPLLVDGAAGTYRLPWSGARRDFYGYLHAFYIYLLLALYFERAARDAGHDAVEVRLLLGHIVGGLREARRDFVADGRFTEAGAGFISSLKKELDILEERLSEAPAPVA